MRGKSILHLSLIAALLTVMMANVGFSAKPPAPPELYMTPTGRLPGPGELGIPGDIIPVEIYISNVENLWACQFTIAYQPFLSVLSPQTFAAGPFLSEGMQDIDWMMNVVTNGLEGTVTFIIMRLPQVDWPPPPRIGESGSGMLASFEFLVVEGGESPIGLVDSILLETYETEPNVWELREIEHTLSEEGAYYYGTTVRLIRVNLPYGRKVHAGDLFTIDAKVKNEGTIPIWVKVRYEIHRFDDGRNIEIYSGQTYGGGGLGEPLPFEYFYADQYLGGGTWGIEDGTWTNPGALVGEPDSVYSECTTAYGTTGWYAFEDVTLAGRVIQNIDLFGYTAQPDGSTSWDFDPYVYAFDTPLDDSGNVVYGAWADSMGGTPTWAWTGGRYYSGGPYDMPEYYGTYGHTEAGFNSLQVFIENYCPSGPRQQIDAMRWKVEYASITPVQVPVYMVMPGEELELGDIIWPSTEEQVGTYELTATIEYSAIEEIAFRKYNSMASPQKTLSFWIVP
jgi:hypothetical protein